MVVSAARTSVQLLLGLSLTSYLGRCVGISMDIERVTTDENKTYPQTTIAQGTLRGVDMVTRKNRSIYGFIGVPFANRSLLLENLTQLIGDTMFIYPSYKAIRIQLTVAESPLYLGVFKYRGNFSKTYVARLGSVEYVGATHGDEIIYLFPYYDTQLALDGYEFTDADWKMMDIMVQLWTSFAINGTPTTAESSVIWEPHSTRNNYLLIGNGTNTALKMQYDLFSERMQFWDELTARTE